MINTAKGQFKIFYKEGAEHPEYVPDFVVETKDCVLMVKTKSQAEMAVRLGSIY